LLFLLLSINNVNILGIENKVVIESYCWEEV